MINLRDNITYLAAFISALAFIWTGCNIYNSKIAPNINIKIYILFFLAQLLWFIDAICNHDYLLLFAYTINMFI